MYVLNSSRPLFRDNPKLRLAVNLALDRTSLSRTRPAAAGPISTSRSTVPGHGIRLIHPLGRRPGGGEERSSDGNTRGGKAVLYVTDFTQPMEHGPARRSSSSTSIGLELEIKPFGEHVTSKAYLGRLGNPDEPWDLALVLWTPGLRRSVGIHQPGARRRGRGRHRIAGLRRGELPRADARAANLLQGAARQKAYRDLDLLLTREAAPLVPLDVLNDATLVSARVGCVLRRPSLVLTTVCLED